jgi:putative copper export protein
MNIKKPLVILNGFIHDFAAGIWLAVMATIVALHRAQSGHPEIAPLLNGLERRFFWVSIAAMVTIMATGAGRTFTYVDNWYGPDAEKVRRRMLVLKHILLVGFFSAGYVYVYDMVFY